MNIDYVLQSHGAVGGKYNKGASLKRNEVIVQAIKSPEMQIDNQLNNEFWLVSDTKNSKTYIYDPVSVGLKKIDEATQTYDWTKAPGAERGSYTWSGNRLGRNLEIDEDGNIYFAIVDNITYEVILRKMDSNGNVLWDRVCTRKTNQYNLSIWRDPNSGYVWVSYDGSNLTFDAFDKLGNKIRSVSTSMAGTVYSFIVEESAQRIYFGGSNAYLYCYSFTGTQIYISNTGAGAGASVWTLQYTDTHILLGYQGSTAINRVYKSNGNLFTSFILPSNDNPHYFQWNKDKTTLYIMGTHNVYTLNSVDRGYPSLINNNSSFTGTASRFGKFLKDDEDFVLAGIKSMSWWKQRYVIK